MSAPVQAQVPASPPDQQTLLSQSSPDVLLNRGIPATFHKVGQDAAGFWIANDEGLTTTHWVQFDNEKLYALEQRYGTLDGWEKALGQQVIGTVIASLETAMGWPTQRVLKAMRSGGMSEYLPAVQGAFYLAMGRDPKAVKTALTRNSGDETPSQGSPTTSPGSVSWETTDDSSGSRSGATGSGPDVTPTSSGDVPPGSGSPSSTPWQ